MLVIPHEPGEDSPEEQGHERLHQEVLPLVRCRPTLRLYCSERRPCISVPFTWNCLLDRLPGDMETYGRYYYTDRTTA